MDDAAAHLTYKRDVTQVQSSPRADTTYTQCNFVY